MGASAWQNLVPFQPDLERALQELRQQVFESGAWYWYPDSPFDPDPPDVERPQTLAELWEDEAVQEEGTHSVIDMFSMAVPGEVRHQTVVLTEEDEAEFATGTTRPTVGDVDELVDSLTEERWIGRAAVLYDDAGEPTQVLFWGVSGD